MLNFVPEMPCSCASSGVGVIRAWSDLYQIGTPHEDAGRVFHARRRFENNSVNEPRFSPARVNCGTVASPSRSRAGRAAETRHTRDAKRPPPGRKSRRGRLLRRPARPGWRQGWFRIRDVQCSCSLTSVTPAPVHPRVRHPRGTAPARSCPHPAPRRWRCWPASTTTMDREAR